MSTDNRTTLNDCSATTGWTGDDAVTVITEAGLYYEGGSSLATQLSNSDEHMYTTSIGGTRNLATSTCYMLIKDNLTADQATGGCKYVLYDGTNDIGYEVGGNDVTGISLATFFNGYRLDVSNSAAFTAHAFAGSEGSLSKTAITGVGYGTWHLSKAAGAIDNVWMDRFSFIANGSAALTINGGTAGTPETMADVAADDITNGWGMVANPSGSLFNVAAPVEWGDSGTASSYFSQSDSQIFLDGTGIGAGNFDMGLIANSTGTNLFQLDNCVVVNLGAVSNWDLSDTNSNTMEITNTQFVNNGTFLLPVTGGTSRKCQFTSFVNCGQVNPSTCTFSDNSFIGTTDATGALLGNIDMLNMSFTSDGTGHAIYITTPGTYEYDGNSFSGYATQVGTATDRVIYNNSGGSVTINVNSGDTPTYRNGTSATTTIVAGAVAQLVNVKDVNGTNIQNARVFVETAATIASGEMFEAAVTSLTQSAGTATCTTTAVHGLITGDIVVIRGAQPDGYNKVATVTVSSTTVFTYAVNSGLSSPATGTPVVSFVALHGLTDASGNITDTRVWGANQQLKGWARKINASSPFYKQADIAYTVDSANGNSTNTVLQPDE